MLSFHYFLPSISTSDFISTSFSHPSKYSHLRYLMSPFHFSAPTVLFFPSTHLPASQVRLSNLKMLQIVMAAVAVGPEVRYDNIYQRVCFSKQRYIIIYVPRSRSAFICTPVSADDSHPLSLDNSSLSSSHPFSLGLPPSLLSDLGKRKHIKLQDNGGDTEQGEHPVPQVGGGSQMNDAV